jgi:hypothetical protein
MRIKMCAREGCPNVAVGVSRWDTRRKPENRFCREDYLATVEPVVAEVIGPCLITDSFTQDGVDLGGEVRLDPLQVDVAQLVYAQHIRIKPAPKVKAAAADKNG